MPTIPRLVKDYCENAICQDNFLVGTFYYSTKLLLETAIEMSQNIDYEINLCSNSSNRQTFKRLFLDYISKSNNWTAFILQRTTFDILATYSYDTLPSTPNVFNYSTSFNLSAIYNSSKKQLIQLKQDVYLNIFKHWNNKTLFICSPQVSPGFMYLTDNRYVPLHMTSGLVSEMLKILSKELKFVPILYEASDNQWGAMMKDSFNFTGCIGDIFNKKSFFGASFYTINSVRSLGIDYSVPYLEDSNVVTLQYPKRESKIWIVFRPFHWGTWISLGVTIVITSVFCYYFSFFTPLSAWNLKLQFSVIDEIRIRENLWNVVGSFLMQGQDFYPYAMSSRTVLAVWWLFTVVIFSAYSADLTSFLTVQLGDKTLKSLEELIERKDIKILLVEGTSSAINLQTSSSELFKKLYALSVFIPTADECPEKVYQSETSNLACISDTSAVLYVVNRRCSKMYIIPESFDFSSLAFPLQMDAPFIPVINKYIQKMVDTGQIEKFFTKYWSTSNVSSDPCSSTTTTEAAPSITLEDVAGIYISIIFLILVSMLMLIFEILWTKLLKKSLDSFIFQS